MTAGAGAVGAATAGGGAAGAAWFRGQAMIAVAATPSTNAPPSHRQDRPARWGMRAVWVEERNIADAGVAAEIAARHGVADAAGAMAKGKVAYEGFTQEAIGRQVFGAPTYAIRDELFWGQDRLDFVERALSR